MSANLSYAQNPFASFFENPFGGSNVEKTHDVGPSASPGQPAGNVPGFKGSIEFSEQEKQIHFDMVLPMAQAAEACLQQHLEHDQQFFKQYKLSPFYGTESDYFLMTAKEKEDYLKSQHFDLSIQKELQQMSCVDLTLICLRSAMEQTNQAAVFKRIRKFVLDNGKDGSSLQVALQRLGWSVLYWNPDTSKNKLYDEAEKKKNPTNETKFWGFHEARYATVMGPRHQFFKNPVDDGMTLVNFGDQPPAFLKSVPYAIATAHGGYHVFSIMNGTVFEGHSGAEITSDRAIESGTFNPMGKDGHPTPDEDFGQYHSGLIVVPPGF